MASMSTGVNGEKPSWSKIAASGLKSQGTQQNTSNTAKAQRHDMSSPPSNGSNLVTPSDHSNSAAFTPKQKKIVPVTPKDSKETGTSHTNSPQVHIEKADDRLQDNMPRNTEGMLMPASADESVTQLSSNDSNKPASLDGKSVTSGTTFALDEKESLRPDDSASVKATDDEDVFSPPESGLPGSRTGSDDDARAFRDQLREISCMEPARQNADGSGHGQGVLYMPPHGTGVGLVPGSVEKPMSASGGMEFPPDSKLLEALDGKDRIMVLKLEQDFVDFVKDAKESSLKLPQLNGYHRMLAHKLADYYMLGHMADDASAAMRIYKTPNCRLPPPLTGIATPSTAASTPPPVGPQMKILRRGVDSVGLPGSSGTNTPSKTASESGEGDEDKRPKLAATREEREAKYEEARKRIMGSAKPSESPDEPFQIGESRSSSAAGKKSTKKKQRSDSDDDFEARSAYSAYYPQHFATAGAAPSSYGYPNAVDPRSAQFSAATYSHHDTVAGYPPYGVPASNQWQGQNVVSGDATPGFPHGHQPGYDLSGEFQRNLNFQHSQPPPQSPYMQPGYNAAYPQTYGGPQRYPHYPAGHPTQQPGSPYVSDYPPHPQTGPNPYHESQTYQYGQLPSQTFPGRIPSKTEHPLPGSYKSKHFNPQSQAFVPGPSNANSAQPFPYPTTQMGHTTYGNAYASMPRNSPLPPPNQSLSSPQPPGPSQRTPSQPMTHPLPQPVFPRQPSPNMPLPPKPEATPPRPFDHALGGTSGQQQSQGSNNSSSIAKWGTPASLPAKPPPSMEPFDPGKFAQTQRQTSQGAARTPNSMPSFGSMPPPSSSQPMNGVGGRSSKRI